MRCENNTQTHVPPDVRRPDWRCTAEAAVLIGYRRGHGPVGTFGACIECARELLANPERFLVGVIPRPVVLCDGCRRQLERSCD